MHNVLAIAPRLPEHIVTSDQMEAAHAFGDRDASNPKELEVRVFSKAYFEANCGRKNEYFALDTQLQDSEAAAQLPCRVNK